MSTILQGDLGASRVPPKAAQPVPPSEPKDGDDQETGSRKMDPELRCLGQMLRMLEDLGQPAATRVMAYLGHRYSKES